MPALRTLGKSDIQHAVPGVDDVQDANSKVAQGQTPYPRSGNPISSTRQPRTLVCSRCGKSYNRRENLIRHLGVHDTIGRFQCQTCRKNFSRSDLLHRHRKSHETTVSISTEESTPARTPLSSDRYSNTLAQDHSRSSLFDVQPGSSSGSESQQQNGIAQQLTNLITNNYDELPLEQSHERSHLDSIWDVNIGLLDTSGLSIGTFDGDMAWTLGFAQLTPGESIPDELLMQFERDPLNDISHVAYRNQDHPIEVEEEEHGEWPDRISRPVSPSRLPGQRNYQTSQYWLAIITEASTMKIDLEFGTRQIQCSIDHASRDKMVALLKLPQSTEVVAGALHEGAFPPTDVLNFFLRLYWRHVHQRFPIIHLPTFDTAEVTPVLLLAMLLVGSEHSESNNGWFTKLFYKQIKSTIVHMMDYESKFLRTTNNLFGLLLICVAGTWSGARENYEFAEGARGMLVTASRRSRLLDCRPAVNGGIHSPGNGRIIDHMWESWIESEQRKRLGLAIYLYDCQFPALFNNQPYISKAETCNAVFPCAEEYWSAPTSDSWKMLLGPANIPPSTYYLHALNSCLLRKREVLPAIAKSDNFGKLILLYALHGHIFEWRQAVSMLNPNGMSNSYGNCVFEIGDGLEDRKNWLFDSLNNWYECYWTSDIDVAAKLLYYLAFVSLDVSLSDVHLAAGRSGSRGEGEIAEQSLRRWANSDTAGKTMSRVSKMLELAHATLDSNGTDGRSFEVLVSLFTGGLVCAAYDRHCVQIERGLYKEQAWKAGQRLRKMGGWQIRALFAAILEATASEKSR